MDISHRIKAKALGNAVADKLDDALDGYLGLVGLNKVKIAIASATRNMLRYILLKYRRLGLKLL